MNPVHKYIRWLHTRWPAGGVERQPEIGPNGQTNVPGLFIVGDLAGIPLLKFAADSAARAVQSIASQKEKSPAQVNQDDVADITVIGGGVAGVAAMAEAKRLGLQAVMVESASTLSTLINMPKGKPIYTYPTQMVPEGVLQFDQAADTKEKLIAELDDFQREHNVESIKGRVVEIKKSKRLLNSHLEDGQVLRSRFVIVAIGRTGDYRQLNVEGEDLDKVSNQLHDPLAYDGKHVLVVGGGDSAAESAVALAECGAHVTLSYRGDQLSRPKVENIAAVERMSSSSSKKTQSHEDSYLGQGQKHGSLDLLLESQVKTIEADEVSLKTRQGETRIPNDAVFAMIGRKAPLGFLRRSGIKILGDWTTARIVSFVCILLVVIFIYHWKKNGVFFPVYETFASQGLFPFNVSAWWVVLGPIFADPKNLIGTLGISLGEPGFYYSLAYSSIVVIFGIRRIRRRKTPYITRQTLSLMAFQVVPLFLLPYLLLPWLGHNGFFDLAFTRPIADALFPLADYGQGREYWRAFGLILAWPLFFWNVFTAQPMWTWLAISLVQTFVIIPIIIRYWGKGAYCGWICSCGALAETLGDTQRQKMPHGPVANRLNLIGQFFLLLSMFLLITRIISWIWPTSFVGDVYDSVFEGIPVFNYVWFVDLFWAGIIGVGFYWHFSGRVWCRFACPLAALMHIYARFSRFRILSDKKKCISCNVCTTVCHQGIDVMNFANKGLPMEDPECVRCSACVQSCPTGVLAFGQIDRKTGQIISKDRVSASPVQQVELTLNGGRMNS
ncbi:MAG: NAD(P)-binding domain-containing protein [Phycisphaerales bacterium]|nr:NAD(P)-binding domain-containing protein [Phycisphaerales bacterium]